MTDPTPTIAAATGPVLTATVIPGDEIDLVGSGFPAQADVLLVITRNGTNAGSRSLETDAVGGFTAAIDAGPGLGGAYLFVATSGSARATVEAVAVETAGSGGTGGLNPSAPPTDMASGPPGRSLLGTTWTLALAAAATGLFIGLGALWRRRRSKIVC